jgi:hypothetical protein
MARRLLLPFLLVLAAACSPAAHAAGGQYVLDGGTRAEQAQVRAALDASSFNWSLVTRTVVIHIGAGSSPHAVAGEIWLDSSLLDAGRFSWGVVQHEYAHQVDFAVLTDAMRERLHPLLGGASWWSGTHSALDCERFADAVAASYWPSADNVLRSVAPPERFRAALGGLLAGSTVRTTASVKAAERHPKG